MKKKKLAKRKTALVPAEPRVEHFSTVAADDLTLPKEFRAAVGLDAGGRPAWFLFDMIAFWELICRIDEKMFDKLSDEEYESVSLGKTIDAIEEQWPFSPAYKAEMKRGYNRALEDIRAGRVRAL